MSDHVWLATIHQPSGTVVVVGVFATQATAEAGCQEAAADGGDWLRDFGAATFGAIELDGIYRSTAASGDIYQVSREQIEGAA